MRRWKWISENPKSFFSSKGSFTKTSLIFSTGTMVWNIQMNLYGLFFHILTFNDFMFLSLYLGMYSNKLESNLKKNKRGFCSSRTYLQKSLSEFKQLSQFSIYGWLFHTNFSRNSPDFPQNPILLFWAYSTLEFWI